MQHHLNANWRCQTTMLHARRLLPLPRPARHRRAHTGAGRDAPGARAPALVLPRRAGSPPARTPRARACSPRRRRASPRLAAASCWRPALGGLLIAAEDAPRISRVVAEPQRAACATSRRCARSPHRVDSREALYARGLARLERLLSDSSGPAYQGGAAALADELARVEDELSGHAGARAPAGRACARRSLRRLARLRRRRPRRRRAPPGFAGGSFTLPDGSWFHGRRDSA